MARGRDGCSQTGLSSCTLDAESCRRLLAEVARTMERHQAEIKRCLERQPSPGEAWKAQLPPHALAPASSPRFRPGTPNGDPCDLLSPQSQAELAAIPGASPIHSSSFPLRATASLPDLGNRDHQMPVALPGSIEDHVLAGTGSTCVSLSDEVETICVDTNALGSNSVELTRSLPKKKSHKTKQFRLFEKSRAEALAHMSMMERIAVSACFSSFSFVLITANALFVGAQTQFYALLAETHAEQGTELANTEPVEFLAAQCVFCALFILELAVRWNAEGLYGFFAGASFGWNLFDVIIVSQTLLDLILASSNQASAGSQISVLRVLRVVRIVRIIRVIRVMRFFRELRMMVYSLMGSLKNLIWIILVLVITFYIFGCAFTTGTTAYLDTTASRTEARNTALRAHFGTLDRSIVSLFMAMSGGNDWGQYYDALALLPAQYCVLFVLFICFTVFALVNIVTGVFVESAMKSDTKDQELVIHEELESKKQYIDSLKVVFEELDTDGMGTISLAEFERSLSEDNVVAYFNALQLDVSDAHKLFTLLDVDQSHEVSVEEFLDGCFKMQGASRALDVKIMQQEIRYLTECMTSLIRKVDSATSNIARLEEPAMSPDDKRLAFRCGQRFAGSP